VLWLNTQLLAQRISLIPSPPRSRSKFNALLPRSKFNLRSPRTLAHCSAGSRTRPANADTHICAG